MPDPPHGLFEFKCTTIIGGTGKSGLTGTLVVALIVSQLHVFRLSYPTYVLKEPWKTMRIIGLLSSGTLDNPLNNGYRHLMQRLIRGASDALLQWIVEALYSKIPYCSWR